MEPHMLVIAAIAILGGICPFVIGCIALGRQEPLARRWDEIPWYMDHSGLAIRVQDMPMNHTSSNNGHNVVDCVEVTKFALDQGFLKIIQ